MAIGWVWYMYVPWFLNSQLVSCDLTSFMMFCGRPVNYYSLIDKCTCTLYVPFCYKQGQLCYNNLFFTHFLKSFFLPFLGAMVSSGVNLGRRNNSGPCCFSDIRENCKIFVCFFRDCCHSSRYFFLYIIIINFFL